MHGSHWLSDKGQKSSRLEGPTDFKLMKISKQHELPKEAMHTCKQLIHQFCTGNELSWERYERNPKYIIYRQIYQCYHLMIPASTVQQCVQFNVESQLMTLPAIVFYAKMHPLFILVVVVLQIAPAKKGTPSFTSCFIL